MTTAPPYGSSDPGPEEAAALRHWASEHYTLGRVIDAQWHPIVIDECERIVRALPARDRFVVALEQGCGDADVIWRLFLLTEVQIQIETRTDLLRRVANNLRELPNIVIALNAGDEATYADLNDR